MKISNLSNNGPKEKVYIDREKNLLGRHMKIMASILGEILALGWQIDPHLYEWPSSVNNGDIFMQHSYNY